MKLGEFFASMLLFIFSVFLFPDINSAIDTMSITGGEALILRAFPMIFLVITGFASVYYGLKEKD